MPTYTITLTVTQEDADSPEDAVRQFAHDLCERGWAWRLTYQVEVPNLNASIDIDAERLERL